MTSSWFTPQRLIIWYVTTCIQFIPLLLLLLMFLIILRWYFIDVTLLAWLFNIQNAFDYVVHNILCNKLPAMGVKPTDWFCSYLSDRQQIVNINSVESDPLDMWGHQGCILGPFLFLCYVNDMPNSSNFLPLSMTVHWYILIKTR